MENLQNDSKRAGGGYCRKDLETPITSRNRRLSPKIERWYSKVGSIPMVQKRFAEIRCDRCSAWFPPPAFLADDPSFDPEWLIGLTFDCPYCGWLTDCDDDNTRARAQSDSFVRTESDILL